MPDLPTPQTPDPVPITVRSEFAAVSVERDQEGNGDRLKLTDLRSGRSAYLDPLVIEALIWSDVSELRDLLDPGRRWIGDGDDEVDDDH